ncbi:type II secretion system protein [Candidatus Saccharibacteria bacterium]|jgi:prepilin-type N-terminal cleavage/methylation domain-containing protein|nr:type II secretion system protein [Candidatus Saccharibacteria bacterium]
MHTSVSGNKTQGFTIIEMLLVLAITGLLMTMTFFGQGSIRTQSQFRDSVEEFRASMESIKSQANNGVTSSPDGCGVVNSGSVGSNPGCVLYGRVIKFTNKTDEYVVTPVYGQGPDSSVFDPSKAVANPQPSSNQEKKLLWGTRFYKNTTPAYKIGFLRHAGNGRLGTYRIGDSKSLNNELSYTGLGKKYTLKLVGTDCDTADVVFNDPINTIRVEFKDTKLCI